MIYDLCGCRKFQIIAVVATVQGMNLTEYGEESGASELFRNYVSSQLQTSTLTTRQ